MFVWLRNDEEYESTPEKMIYGLYSGTLDLVLLFKNPHLLHKEYTYI